MIHLTIDGQMLEVQEGLTILQAAKRANIEIPTLCYLKNVSSIGACRMCVVEVEGMDKLPTACNTPVRESMVISTMSEKVIAARKLALTLILADHNKDCTNCFNSGKCELQKLCLEYAVEESPLTGTRPMGEYKDVHPFLGYRPDKCIHCQRCVNTCAVVTGRRAITAGRNGGLDIINAPFGADWKSNLCESCGNCAEACPTAALYKKNEQDYRSWEVQRVRTTCPHCAIGCQLDLLVKDGRIVGAEGADGPSNHGRLCVKGRFASYKFVESGDRLTDPLIRDRATGMFRKASWDEALDLVATKFTELKNAYGGDSLAGFACSRSTNEDVYMLQKMVRTAFGSNNTDNCARV